MQEKIYFYYTNDLHSNFEQWPKVVSFMKEAKVKREKANDPYWLFDIGDHVDRVHPISEALLGKGNISLLNDLGYDFVTLGNNEGITFAHEDLYHLYDEAEFQIVCANLASLDDNSPDWLQSSAHIQTNQGVRIGVIGLTAPFNDYYELLGWHVDNPYEVLEKLVTELRETTDIIVLLSHLGISEDQEIARKFTDIDVIIGGHTHHLLRTGEEVNQAIITAAGKQCYYVGEVILTWDVNQEKIVKKEAYTTDISEFPTDAETRLKLDFLHNKAENMLDQTVVTIDKPIEINWYESSKLMEALTDKLKRVTGADCAMLNMGLLLDGFSEGRITLGDIHRVCPHPINPCMVELTGAEIIEVVRASFTKEFMEFQLKGFGFRGKVLGKMVFAGLDIVTATHRNGQEYVEEIHIHGVPVRKERTYTLTVPDAFTFGRLLPEVAKSEKKSYILPYFIRDFLADTLREHFGS